MIAHAAESAGDHAQAFYTGAEFWILVAFVVLLAFVAKPMFRIIVTALDDRAETIKNRIEEAAQLRDKAQELLASYQRKHRDAVAEAEEIVGRAREEADRVAARATLEVEKALRRREQLAIERIAQAEAKAVQQVRAMAADVALEATRRLLIENIKGRKADALIEAATKDIPKKLSKKLH